MKNITRAAVISSLVVLGLGACRSGHNKTKLQYMPDMADNPTTKAQESFIDPPAHSVAINAILYPATPELAEAELKNPFGEDIAQISAPMKERGKHLFDTYCAVCHGFDAKGKGPMGDAYPIAAPDLTRDDLKAKKDGYFFYRISKGANLMPSYAYATSPYERWWIITHIRGLQQGSAKTEPSGIHVNPSQPLLNANAQ
ncbi:MAG: c-type cytochrome [Bdellovibrionota bacterium]